MPETFELVCSVCRQPITEEHNCVFRCFEIRKTVATKVNKTTSTREKCFPEKTGIAFNETNNLTSDR